MRRARVSQFLVLIALILTISLPSLGESPKESPLTNADLVRLVKAGISESTIVRLMQVSETNFTTTANALVELKHHHVPDQVIDALLDDHRGANNNHDELQDSSPNEPLTPGEHGLPNFDAAVHLNARTNAKIAVRSNHIQVENAGHPLFSVSWKENNSN